MKSREEKSDEIEIESMENNVYYQKLLLLPHKERKCGENGGRHVKTSLSSS